MDAQSVEIVGRNLLVTELVRDGVEVARPERDRGVDLIAYLDVDESGTFCACPIQMKASTRAAFGLFRKYERIHGLVLAYVWGVGGPSTETFGLTYSEALAVAEAMGWTATLSWKREGYTTTRPSAKLRGLLEPHRMVPGRWLEKVREASG